MAEIVLTDEQNDAVQWIVEQVGAGVPVVALRGLAGTGKTSIIPALRTAIEALGHWHSPGRGDPPRQDGAAAQRAAKTRRPTTSMP